MIVNFAERAHNHNWTLDPVTRSLLDTDFYKLLMLQFIWKHYPKTHVSFSLFNRTAAVRLAEMFSRGELAAQMGEAGPVVVNASARPRGGVVEVVLAGSGPVEGAALHVTREVEREHQPDRSAPRRACGSGIGGPASEAARTVAGPGRCHTTHGASPRAYRSSRRCLSLNVSIDCQNPS